MPQRSDDALFENVAKPIARRFGVSPAEMRIRLESPVLKVKCQLDRPADADTWLATKRRSSTSVRGDSDDRN